MIDDPDPEYLEWKQREQDRERKRGGYWLTSEGRAELRDIFGDDATGHTMVLLNEVERLETILRDPKEGP